MNQKDKQFIILLLLGLIIIFILGIILFPDVFIEKKCYTLYPDGTKYYHNCSVEKSFGDFSTK